MSISPLAGKPAPASMLLDIPKLVTALRDGAASRRCRIASTSPSPTAPTTIVTASSHGGRIDESQ
jgi:hypothetical protein